MLSMTHVFENQSKLQFYVARTELPSILNSSKRGLFTACYNYVFSKNVVFDGIPGV